MRKKIRWHVILVTRDGHKIYVSGIKELGFETKIDFSKFKQHARLYQSAGQAILDAKWIGLALELPTKVESL